MQEDIVRASCHNRSISYGQSIQYPPFPPHFLHAHENCEIFCVFRGNGHYITEGTRHKFEPGKILLMRSGESHRPDLSGDEPYARLALHFSPEIVDSFDPERKLLRPFFDRPLGLHNVYDRSVVAQTEIYGLFRKMTLLTGNNYLDCLHVTSLLFAVLEELCALFDAGLFNAPTQGAALMRNVVAYVNENLTAPLSLDQICGKFYLSRGQLSRYFKNSTGTSVWDYIVTKRLILARGYIASGMGAQEAAKACGFSDYSAFYRAYSKKYGMSPTGSSRSL